MRNKRCLFVVSLFVFIALLGTAYAQDFNLYETKYFTISMPTNCRVMTRLEFDQGLYENDPDSRTAAYTEKATSFVTEDTLELTCSNLKGLYSMKIQVYDANEDYVTTGREIGRILSVYDKWFDSVEEKDDSITISKAKAHRTDGANYIYVDKVSPFHYYDQYDREYYFSFPWKGQVKMFVFTISTLEESLNSSRIDIAEACLESLSIKY